MDFPAPLLAVVDEFDVAELTGLDFIRYNYGGIVGLIGESVLPFIAYMMEAYYTMLTGVLPDSDFYLYNAMIIKIKQFVLQFSLNIF